MAGSMCENLAGATNLDARRSKTTSDERSTNKFVAMMYTSKLRHTS